MFYKILADLIVIAHLLWIIFLIFGAIWGKLNRAVRIIHISALTFACFIQLAGWYCPLTYLEVWLKSKHDPALAYTGAFIAHYAEKLVYADLSRGLVIAATVVLFAFNAWFYFGKRK